MCIVVHAANKKKGLSPLDFIGGGVGILPNVGNGLVPFRHVVST